MAAAAAEAVFGVAAALDLSLGGGGDLVGTSGGGDRCCAASLAESPAELFSNDLLFFLKLQDEIVV